MKIKNVQLKNFRNHQNSVIPMNKINVITGKNNSGKSSIKGAIQFALTGESEWTTTGKDAKSLIQNGFKGASTILEIDGLGTIERRITASTNTLKLNNTTVPNKELDHELKELFNLETEPIKYIIDSEKFFNLSPDKQKDFMFKTLGINLNQETIIKFMENPNEEAIKKIKSKLKDNVSIEDFDKLYKDLYNERKIAKKEKENFENQYSVLNVEKTSPIDIEKLDNSIKDLNNKKGVILKKIANIQSKEENLKTLKKYLTDIQSKIKSTKETLKIDINKLEDTRKEIDTLGKQYTKFNGLLVKNKTASNVLLEQNKNLQQMLNKLSGNICPLSDKLICKTDKSSLKNEMQQNIDKNSKNITIAQENITKLENCVQKIINKKDFLNNQINICINLINLINQEKQYEEDIKKIDIKENVEDSNKELIVINDEINKIMEDKNKYNTWLENSNKKKLLEENIQTKKQLIEVLDYLIVEFSPKGVKSRILKQIISPIEDQCNTNLNVLTNGRYELKFDFSNDFEIVINKDGDIIPIKCLSNSEKLRIAVIIQDAINKTTGFNILIIDNVEILDKENETLFIDLIQQIQDEYENIIIISTNLINIPNAINFQITEGNVVINTKY